MELNVKLLLDEMSKQIRSDIAKGFAEHLEAMEKRLAEMSSAEQQCSEHVEALESSAVEFDKTFEVWKPEIEASISTIKLEAPNSTSSSSARHCSPASSVSKRIPDISNMASSPTRSPATASTIHTATHHSAPCSPMCTRRPRIPQRLLQERNILCGESVRHQALVQWSAMPGDLATWEDIDRLRQEFPQAPAWGQASSSGGGNVSSTCPREPSDLTHFS